MAFLPYISPSEAAFRDGALTPKLPSWMMPKRPPISIPRPNLPSTSGPGNYMAGRGDAGFRNPYPSRNPMDTVRGTPQHTVVPSQPSVMPKPIMMDDYLAQQNTINTQAKSQYEELMNMFKGFMSEGETPYEDITPELETYTRDASLDDVFRRLTEQNQTGGYSDADLSNIRERAISPIRSLYASGERNLNRQRALQGNYAPGFAAALSRMMREQGEQIGNTTTAANAEIAKMVAEGKRFGLGSLAELASKESSQKNEVNARNIAAKNAAKETNAKTKLSLKEAEKGRKGDALTKMLSLYGTTPALANMFGSNALQGKELQSRLQNQLFSQGMNEKEFNSREGLSLIDMFLRAMRG